MSNYTHMIFLTSIFWLLKSSRIKLENRLETITIYSTILKISEAQELVDQWIKKYGVRYFNELTNMAQLTEEVGEVARIISRRYGEQSEKESDKDKDLGEELADVLWVLICLANQTGIDLESALKENIRKKTDRDGTRHLDNKKLK